MYMTVLKMNRNSILNASNLLDVNSSNSVHKWLCNQQDMSRKENGLLYKIINNDNDIFMYIQSNTPFNRKGIEESGFVFVKDFDLSNINLDNISFFDVQCFPYKTVQNKRYFIKNMNDRYHWLQKKLAENGIELINCTEYKLSNIIFDKDKRKSIETASYKGNIKIVDKELAYNLFSNGLGRFKNYGLGLILFR